MNSTLTEFKSTSINVTFDKLNLSLLPIIRKESMNCVR